MAGFFRDLRFALRLVLKNPGFTAIAVLTLGLGIGAVTAIFSVVNAVILRPLPFPKPEQLVQVYTEFPQQKFNKFWLSPPEYFDISREVSSFASVTGYQVAGAAISARERPMRAAAAYTTWTFARTIGVEPVLGRYFGPHEDLPGDVTSFVISHRLWKNAFAGDPEIIGKRVVLDGMTAAIVGVMPEGFAFPAEDTDLWIPSGVDPSSIRRGNHFLTVIARMQPGATLAQARGEISSLMSAWGGTGGHRLNAADHPLVIYSLKDELIGSARAPLWMLQMAVLFVLLIASANVSNLLLARAEARAREIAVRNALGAGRGRLLVQFLTESLILGFFGAVVGLLFAIWGVDMTVSLLPKGAPRAAEIAIDLRVLGFGVGVALLTSLIFGLAPMLHTRVVDLAGALKEGQRTAGSPRQKLRRALVIGEVALAVVLVIGCGLVIKSFVKLQQVELGFNPENVVTGRVEIVDKSYPTPDAMLSFWLRLEERMRGLPGVDAVAVAAGLPPTRRLNANDAFFEGVAQPPEGPIHNIDFWNTVGEDYVRSMGLRVVAGRFLTAADTNDTPGVVVINETLARKFYPGQDPIGRRLQVAGGGRPDGKWQTIVGVVADVKQQGLDAPTGTEAYMSIRQTKTIYGGIPQNMILTVKGAASPATTMAALRRVVTEMDATVPVYDLRTMDKVLYEAVGKPRFITFLLGVFAGLALLLASIGIYGVMSYSVAQRTRELGIRMALGARAGGVRRLVMAEGLLLAGVGVVLGLGIAFAVNTGLATQVAALLYDVRAVDPMTFAGVTVVVLLVAALASFVPAVRATRVDPMVALRHD